MNGCDKRRRQGKCLNGSFYDVDLVKTLFQESRLGTRVLVSLEFSSSFHPLQIDYSSRVKFIIKFIQSQSPQIQLSLIDGRSIGNKELFHALTWFKVKADPFDETASFLSLCCVLLVHAKMISKCACSSLKQRAIKTAMIYIMLLVEEFRS